MTERRRSAVYARRRDLRADPLPSPPPGTLAAWTVEALRDPPGFQGAPPLQRPPSLDADAGSRGPTTQDLQLYHPEPALPARSEPPLPARHGSGGGGMPPELGHEGRPADRGERMRTFVERWSLWAAGLGKPPREASGGRRYPSREGLLPPVLLLAAALGVAGLIGLLAGLLIASPGGDAATAGAARPTVTVTRRVTPPAITETRTRTRTRTVTAAPQEPNVPVVLGPGSQGPAVTQLQQDLAALGLFQGQPSGSYDAETRAGVRAFQGGFGVTGDPPGVAGPATVAALAHAVGRA